MENPEKYFFDIPIYRYSLEEHNKQMKSMENDFLSGFKDCKKSAPETYNMAPIRFDDFLWYPWYYNEIIGWIRLYASESMIRGEKWYVRAKRHVRRARKQFRFVGKEFELHFNHIQQDEDIANDLLKKLKELQEGRSYKGRVVFIECLSSVAPYIRWRELLGFSS